MKWTSIFSFLLSLSIGNAMAQDPKITIVGPVLQV